MLTCSLLLAQSLSILRSAQKIEMSGSVGVSPVLSSAITIFLRACRAFFASVLVSFGRPDPDIKLFQLQCWPLLARVRSTRGYVQK